SSGALPDRRAIGDRPRYGVALGGRAFAGQGGHGGARSPVPFERWTTSSPTAAGLSTTPTRAAAPTSPAISPARSSSTSSASSPRRRAPPGGTRSPRRTTSPG